MLQWKVKYSTGKSLKGVTSADVHGHSSNGLNIFSFPPLMTSVPRTQEAMLSGCPSLTLPVYFSPILEQIPWEAPGNSLSLVLIEEICPCILTANSSHKCFLLRNPWLSLWPHQKFYQRLLPAWEDGDARLKGQSLVAHRWAPQFLFGPGHMSKMNTSLAIECVIWPVKCQGVTDTGSNITIFHKKSMKQGVQIWTM